MQSILQAIMAVARDEKRDEPSNKSLQSGPAQAPAPELNR